MERKHLKDLVDWVNNPKRKPLLIYGARQVGKTYLIKELFAKKYFKDKYIYIDCHNDVDFTEFCLNNCNLNNVVEWIEAHYNLKLTSKTLLVFDEAQECPPVISLMKYFCQDRNDIPLIVTGSMVQIKLKRSAKEKNFLFPIGKINELTIYPLNFEEYLLNKNKVLLEDIRNAYNKKTKVSEAIHASGLQAFKEYISIGGMPEVVSEYLESKSLLQTKKTIKALYDNYLNDMLIYQKSNLLATKTHLVYNNLFNQLNKENKNFKYSSINSKFKNRDLANPVDWLVLSFIINISYCLKERVTYPLIPYNPSLFRLYNSDIGLFVYQSNETIESFLDKNKINTLAGIFFETYVAIELVNAGFKLFFWKGKHENEMEFIVQTNGKLIPIDVKKTKGSLASLDNYKQHNHVDYAIKVSINNYNYDKTSKILTIPFCMFFLLCNDWKENKDVINGWKI